MSAATHVFLAANAEFGKPNVRRAEVWLLHGVGGGATLIAAEPPATDPLVDGAVVVDLSSRAPDAIAAPSALVGGGVWILPPGEELNCDRPPSDVPSNAVAMVLALDESAHPDGAQLARFRDAIESDVRDLVSATLLRDAAPALRCVSLAVRSPTDEEQLARNVLDAMLQLSSAEVGIILLAEPGKPDFLRVVAAKNADLFVPGEVRHIDAFGLIASAAADGEAYFAPGMTAPFVQITTSTAIRSAYARSLAHDGQLLAVIDVESTRSHIPELHRHHVREIGEIFRSQLISLRAQRERDRLRIQGDARINGPHGAAGSLQTLFCPDLLRIAAKSPPEIRASILVVAEGLRTEADRLRRSSHFEEALAATPSEVGLIQLCSAIASREPRRRYGVGLVVRGAESATVLTSRLGIEVALDNLLMNTAKHASPPAGASVTAVVEVSRGERGGRWQLRYFDNGTALPGRTPPRGQEGFGLRLLLRLARVLRWHVRIGSTATGAFLVDVEFP